MRVYRLDRRFFGIGDALDLVRGALDTMAPDAIGPLVEFTRLALGSREVSDTLKTLPDRPWLEATLAVDNGTSLSRLARVVSPEAGDEYRLYVAPMGAVFCEYDGSSWSISVDFSAPHPDTNDMDPIPYEQMLGLESRAQVVGFVMKALGVSVTDEQVRNEFRGRRHDEHTLGDSLRVRVGRWDHETQLNGSIAMRLSRSLDPASLIGSVVESVDGGIAWRARLMASPRRIEDVQRSALGISGWISYGNSSEVRRFWAGTEAAGTSQVEAEWRACTVPEETILRIAKFVEGAQAERAVFRWGVTAKMAFHNVEVEASSGRGTPKVYVALDGASPEKGTLPSFERALGGELRHQPL